MSFFEKLKEFRTQLREVENNIYTNKQDYLEIYEKNLQLEKEIAKRTEELDLANKRILSLQHIWDMMNSSTPLSSVLNEIVQSLQGEIGYINSCIIKKSEDESGAYLNMISYDSNALVERINQMGDISLQTMRFTYAPNGIIAKAINSKKIYQSIDTKNVFADAIPALSADKLDKIIRNIRTKSIIIIPLVTRTNEFGCLAVFSSRDKASDAELNFLSLFAKQIELAITIADLFQAVKEQAVTDGLTGLYNRRYFEEFMQKEVIRSNRMGQPFSLIGIDLDHLKDINDQFGHSYGDLAIKAVAEVLKKNARAVDIVARMGGEEFNSILPGVDSKGAMIAAERIRKAIEGSEIEKIGPITASIGVATFFEHSENMDELVELTDQAMYFSKRNGRNQVNLAKPISRTAWQEIAINAFVDILSKHRIPVDKKISEDLCKRLETSDLSKSSPSDMLYSVADILTSVYNPMQERGVAKSKLILASNFAKRLDLSKEEIDKLKVAILLYDIGNMMVPQDILQKQDSLTPEELRQIKEHPILAVRDILKPISQIQDVIPIIEHHHENWDGSGYPSKMAGDDIPLLSQIILITDAYFALTAPRAYRPAMSSEDALKTIEADSDKKWSPNLVKEFVALISSELK